MLQETSHLTSNALCGAVANAEQLLMLLHLGDVVAVTVIVEQLSKGGLETDGSPRVLHSILRGQ